MQHTCGVVFLLVHISFVRHVPIMFRFLCVDGKYQLDTGQQQPPPPPPESPSQTAPALSRQSEPPPNSEQPIVSSSEHNNEPVIISPAEVKVENPAAVEMNVAQSSVTNIIQGTKSDSVVKTDNRTADYVSKIRSSANFRPIQHTSSAKRQHDEKSQQRQKELQNGGDQLLKGSSRPSSKHNSYLKDSKLSDSNYHSRSESEAKTRNNDSSSARAKKRDSGLVNNLSVIEPVGDVSSSLIGSQFDDAFETTESCEAIGTTTVGSVHTATDVSVTSEKQLQLKTKSHTGKKCFYHFRLANSK